MTRSIYARAGVFGLAVLLLAFPDSIGMLAAQGGQRLAMAANFGVVISDDGGAHWHLICEQITGTNASQYQMGPPPGHALYAASFDGLRFGDDNSCGWTTAGGSLAGAAVSDVWPDASNADRVLALARPENPDHSLGPVGLYQSLDGGKTFGAPLYAATGNLDLTGVETARSDQGQTVYMTMTDPGPPVHPYILRSTDGGGHWDVLDALPGLGNRVPRLAAVDPADARRLYLRVTDVSASADPDALVISDDGGETFRFPMLAGGTALRLSYPMTAFLRRSDGAVIVAAGNARGVPTAYISMDGGHTFSAWLNAPHIRGLAERGGDLFAATDSITDGYAVGVSHDQGASWQPLLKIENICGVARCREVAAACDPDWPVLRIQIGIPADACGELADAGISTTPQPTPRGCHCASGAPDLAGWAALCLPGLGVLARRRRRVLPRRDERRAPV